MVAQDNSKEAMGDLPGTTTATTTMFNPMLQRKISRLDSFPVYSLAGNPVIDQIGANEILHKMIGLNYYFDCIAKAEIVERLLWPDYPAVIGSMYCRDEKSNYGFEFKKPLEFHCWNEGPGGIIIDFGLPGVISAGLTCCDEQGPFLLAKNWKPVILAGEPNPNMIYNRYEKMR
jgi:hypothetical protein